MTESVASLGVTEAPTAEGARPSIDLPIGALLRISALWLGLTAIDAAVGRGRPEPHRVRRLGRRARVGGRCSSSASPVRVVGIIVQPTVGSISDYTTSPLGPRKPYIVFGPCSTSCSSSGSRTANSLLAIAAFVMLLQFSTNIARGPFQGYVPDLVPEQQVGLASGWSA